MGPANVLDSRLVGAVGQGSVCRRRARTQRRWKHTPLAARNLGHPVTFQHELDEGPGRDSSWHRSGRSDSTAGVVQPRHTGQFAARETFASRCRPWLREPPDGGSNPACTTCAMAPGRARSTEVPPEDRDQFPTLNWSGVHQRVRLQCVPDALKHNLHRLGGSRVGCDQSNFVQARRPARCRPVPTPRHAGTQRRVR